MCESRVLNSLVWMPMVQRIRVLVRKKGKIGLCMNLMRVCHELRNVVNSVLCT